MVVSNDLTIAAAPASDPAKPSGTAVSPACGNLTSSITLSSTPEAGVTYSLWNVTTSSAVAGSSPWTGLAAGTYRIRATKTGACNVVVSNDMTIGAMPQCTNFCGYTQGFWANKNGLAMIKTQGLLSKPLVFGAGNYTFTIPAVSDILYKNMPKGTRPAALNRSMVWTKGGSYNNNLLSQTITLTLNSMIKTNPIHTGFVIQSGCMVTGRGTYPVNQNVYNYLSSKNKATVGGLLELANQLLGRALVPGNGVPTYAEVTSVLDMFNNAFDECSTFGGWTVCPIKTTTTSTLAPVNSRLSVATVEVKASPNPYTDKIRFNIFTPVSGKGSLDAYTIAGQKVATVFAGDLKAGEKRTVEFIVPAGQRRTLTYSFRISGQQVSGTLINK